MRKFNVESLREAFHPLLREEAGETLERVKICFGDACFDVFHTDADDHIYRVLLNSKGFYEVEFLVAISRFLTNNDFVLDVGANIGNHALFLAGVLGCQVSCFEPNSRAISLLQRNISANALNAQVDIWPFALGAAPGLFSADPSLAKHNLGAVRLRPAEHGEIRVVSLDQIDFGRAIKLIKIDVEGMELDVLLGAKETIQRDRPVICVECDEVGKFNAIFDYLSDLGYSVLESHNYTPVHVFVQNDASFEMAAWLSRQLAVRYITQGHSIHRLQKQARDTGEKLSALGTEVASARQKHEAAQQAMAEKIEILASSIAKIEENLRAAKSRTFRARLRKIFFITRNKIVWLLKQLNAGRSAACAKIRSKIADKRKSRRPSTPTFNLSAVPVIIGQSLGTRNTWRKSVPFGPVKLLENGWMKSSPGDEAGVILGPFSTTQGGLVRAIFNIEIEPGSPPLVLSLQTNDNHSIGPDEVLRAGENSILAFAPLRTSSLNARLTFLNPREAGASRITSFVLEALDSEKHYSEQKTAGLPATIASLASIPSRQDILADCVASLLPQADIIRVFLNGYEAVPDFLSHKRIEVRRSQDWDDRGDAGKFFWIETDDEPGYRLIVDDDLIFPPDFASVTTRMVAEQNDRAIAGVHGVLIRQPFAHYHESKSRAKTFHFAGALARQRTVHILGTNALCMHSSTVQMRWADFLYCNSADIWLALYAQQHRIPMLALPRPKNWIRENVSASPIDTIYRHSLDKSRSRFDSSLVQNAALKRALPLTLQPSARRKFIVCTLAREAKSLNALAESWVLTISEDYDWVFVVAPLNESSSLAEAAGVLAVAHEVHVLPCCETEKHQIEATISFAAKLAANWVFIAFDELRFEKPGWDIEMIDAMSQGKAGTTLLLSKMEPDLTGPESVWTPMCLAFGSEIARSDSGLRGLLSVSGELLTRGKLNENNPTINIRALPGLSAKRLEIGQIGTQTASEPAAPAVDSSAQNVNSLFERIVYINLDRRSDRRRLFEAELEHHGIRAERFAALDGSSQAMRIEYEAYLKEPLRRVSNLPKPLHNSEDFYFRYESQASRVAMQERAKGAKSISSAGAWAYLRSWERILEQALQDGVETLLVLDDDVQFHRDTSLILRQATEDLPDDWLVLQLGTLQYDWNAPWVEWRSPALYRTNGCAIGSYAVGLRFDAMVYLLDRVKMMELPFDIGPLSGITRDFASQCFVVFPNVAIQSRADSDIGTLDFQTRLSIEEIAQTYRWILSDYGVGKRETELTT